MMKDKVITELLSRIAKLEYEVERLNNIINEVREIFKDYGVKEDIVNYTMYYISGEMILTVLEILDKVDKENK